MRGSVYACARMASGERSRYSGGSLKYRTLNSLPPPAPSRPLPVTRTPTKTFARVQHPFNCFAWARACVFPFFRSQPFEETGGSGFCSLIQEPSWSLIHFDLIRRIFAFINVIVTRGNRVDSKKSFLFLFFIFFFFISDFEGIKQKRRRGLSISCYRPSWIGLGIRVRQGLRAFYCK